MSLLYRTLAAAAVLSLSASAHAAFTINLTFGSGLTASQQAIFTTARDNWLAVIGDYKPGVNLSGITINASGPNIDGPGGVLGSAGPSTVATRLGTTYTVTGQMRFDAADLATMQANGTLLSVIQHEMGHVLGLGTLWTLNGLYTQGSGRYTGPSALAMWRVEFNQPNATYVPVELDGGSGTANSHWDELNGGSGLTGRKDPFGRDMRNELMTGWLNAPTFLSQTTIAQFEDLGYQVFARPVIPEPATAGLLLPAATLLRRRRRDLPA